VSLLRYIELKTGFNDDGPAWIGRIRDSYWISGVKKSGQDRHYAGSGPITIEDAAVEEYLKETGATELDLSVFRITHDIQPTDSGKFHRLENEPWE
jgi:hypothetical protein